MAYNCLIRETTIILIKSEDFVTKRLSSVFKAESKSYWPQMSKQSRHGKYCVRMRRNTGYRLISKRNLKLLKLYINWKSGWNAVTLHVKRSS